MLLSNYHHRHCAECRSDLRALTGPVVPDGNRRLLANGAGFTEGTMGVVGAYRFCCTDVHDPREYWQPAPDKMGRDKGIETRSM
jgi:hypothetical protein